METDKNGEDIVFNEKPNPTGEVVGIIKINWEQYDFILILYTCIYIYIYIYFFINIKNKRRKYKYK